MQDICLASNHYPCRRTIVSQRKYVLMCVTFLLTLLPFKISGQQVWLVNQDARNSSSRLGRRPRGNENKSLSAALGSCRLDYICGACVALFSARLWREFPLCVIGCFDWGC